MGEYSPEGTPMRIVGCRGPKDGEGGTWMTSEGVGDPGSWSVTVFDADADPVVVFCDSRREM